MRRTTTLGSIAGLILFVATAVLPAGSPDFGKKAYTYKTVGGVALVDTSLFLLGTTLSLPPLSH